MFRAAFLFYSVVCYELVCARRHAVSTSPCCRCECSSALSDDPESIKLTEWKQTQILIITTSQTMFELSGSIYENLIISFIDGLTSVYLLKNKHQPKRFVFIIGEESMKRSSKICWLLVLLQMICCSEEVPVYFLSFIWWPAVVWE